MYYGSGSQWDEEGNLIYKGEFVNGAYNGQGVFYNVSNGKIMLEGQFRNNLPVPEEEIPNPAAQTVPSPSEDTEISENSEVSETPIMETQQTEGSEPE